MQLSSDQQKAWNKVYLLFIDLYHIGYKACEAIVIECNSNRKPEEAPMDLNHRDIELMKLMFPQEDNGPENSED